MFWDYTRFCYFRTNFCRCCFSECSAFWDYTRFCYFRLCFCRIYGWTTVCYAISTRMTMLQEKCHEEPIYSLSICVQPDAYCTRAYVCASVSEHASIREQVFTLACLLAHACVRSNVASAASATYLWHFHTQYGENRVDVASGVCENNAHPFRARYSSALPPYPPISMLRMMRVMFGLRKKTLTFSGRGFFAHAPTLKWGVRGVAPPAQGSYR